MPHTQSAKKRLRQSQKRRVRNRAIMKGLKKEIKRTLAAAKAGNADDTAQFARTVSKKLDKAAVRRVIHPNLAARKKSQMARLVNSVAANAQQN